MSSEDAPGPSSSEGLESDLTSRIMNNLRTSIAAEVKLAVEASKRQFTELAAEACINNLDELADKVTKKARVDLPEFKRKGTKDQYGHNQSVLGEIEGAMLAISKQECAKATERLQKGKTLLLKRLKAIKIADREEHGWALVRHYESDALASDNEDEKEIGRARRASAADIKLRDQKRKDKAISSKQKSERAGGVARPRGYTHRTDYRGHKPVICFSCNKEGTFRKIVFLNTGILERTFSF